MAEIAREWLDGAFAGTSAELCALVLDDADGALAGLVIYGLVAGTVGAGRVHLVAWETRTSGACGGHAESCATLRDALDAESRAALPPTPGDALISAALGALRQLGARLALAELPDATLFAPMRAVLERAGFARVGEVADYYRDGMPLALWRLDISR